MENDPNNANAPATIADLAEAVAATKGEFKELFNTQKEEMERLLANTAKLAGVGLFRRFEIMRHWQEQAAADSAMIGPDGLHMTDRGYHCLAVKLAEALAANWALKGAPAVAGLHREALTTPPAPPH